jgi:hypothetical protein
MMAIYKIKTDIPTSDLRTCIEEANANMLFTPANELLKKGRLALFDDMSDLYDKMKTNPGEVSDGYHTFNELYHHRAILFATICNTYPTKAWKSLQHDDPDFPMYEGMFIVGIETPDGQATYHYDIDPYWNIFNVKELERAPKYDGHTPDEAIRRIGLMGGFDLSK